MDMHYIVVCEAVCTYLCRHLVSTFAQIEHDSLLLAWQVASDCKKEYKY